MNVSPICVCNSQHGRLSRIPGPVFGQRQLFGCDACGTVQLFPPPVQEEELTALYQDAGYMAKIPRAEYFGYFKVFDEYIRQVLGLSKDIAILDFGAGWCYYQLFFLEQGYREAHSLEINRNLVRNATEKLGLKNVYSDAKELTPGYYDLILSNQVFEHLANPIRELEQTLLPLAKVGGLICFSVPNWDSLNRPVLRQRWLGYSPEDHIWFFGKKSIRNLLSNSPHFDLVDITVRSAVGKSYDGFRPNGAVKRIYYNTVWRFFEFLGRSDQLIVTLRKKGNA